MRWPWYTRRGWCTVTSSPRTSLIDSYGNLGLADFGLAAAWERCSAALTSAYAPPEVIRGDDPNESSEVYQLAATLYALLSGHQPPETTGTSTSLDELKKRRRAGQAAAGGERRPHAGAARWSLSGTE
jgi:serine/threonine protein kinase